METKITSVRNEKVRFISLLQQKAAERKKSGLFAAEGLRFVMDTPTQFMQELFIREDLDLQIRSDLENRFPGVPVSLVTGPVMEKMADTRSPQGVMALVKMPSHSEEEIISGSGKPLIMILEDIQDPGNLGTIFRTAEAAGVTGILLSGGCVDVFNPKVIRSTMSAVFRMPFALCSDLPEAVSKLKDKGIIVCAAWLRGSVPYDSLSYLSGTAFMIGNEARGLTEELAASADEKIRIPMEGEIESLNAAISAGILMYEAYRQRRSAGV